ncbi:MAG: hypothetical protein M5R36_08000 [Deltaproteobacteria bacterium]|nr:hypothetical protein [Deltaproteobacteria bacterium]
MRIPAHTILAVLFLAASCARVAVDADRVYEGDYDSYLGVLSEWTRTDKVYHNFETELVVGATFHGKPYRDALRGEKARAEKLSPNESPG